MANSRADNVIVFDMDSTLIQIECIDEIAALTGAGAQVAAITERAMRGELDFEQSLRERVACLKGVSVNEFEKIFNPLPLTAGAELLISTLQQAGWRTVLVSGGFEWFAERVAAALKLDEYYANVLVTQAMTLTGEVGEPVVDANYKAMQVSRLKQQAAHVVAVGDGANDIAMLEVADLGVAFCAKPALRKVADICIEQPDLSLLLPELKKLGLIS
jgi:phosphoserine phosphatase